MTVLAFLGRYGSNQANGWITMNQIDRTGGDGVAIDFPTPIPKDASGYVLVKSDSFDRLALCMMAVDRKAAIKAFCAALQTDPEEARKAFGIIRDVRFQAQKTRCEGENPNSDDANLSGDFLGALTEHV
jgi:hypothetical protein